MTFSCSHLSAVVVYVAIKYSIPSMVSRRLGLVVGAAADDVEVEEVEEAEAGLDIPPPPEGFDMLMPPPGLAAAGRLLVDAAFTMGLEVPEAEAGGFEIGMLFLMLYKWK